MNGLFDKEESDESNFFLKFSCTFKKKRIFNYFSNELFRYMGKIVEPFDNLDDAIYMDRLDIVNIVRRYETYLKKNGKWLLKDAPRRKDLRVYEAVFHFNLYMYLFTLLENNQGMVYPEFPTGNGRIDIMIKYANKNYGIELKSYTNERDYKKGLEQAVSYGRQAEICEVYLVFFVEYIDEANRKKYEVCHTDKKTGIKVVPIFVETKN